MIIYVPALETEPRCSNGAPRNTWYLDIAKPVNCMCALLTLTGTEKSLWDGVLHNVKVVVSTYQILQDALTHAFVRMESLALIVFDEGTVLSR